MDLIFDQLPCPHKTVRNPTDHINIGMTTYYGINFKNSKCVKKILGYALPGAAALLFFFFHLCCRFTMAGILKFIFISDNKTGRGR